MQPFKDSYKNIIHQKKEIENNSQCDYSPTTIIRRDYSKIACRASTFSSVQKMSRI